MFCVAWSTQEEEEEKEEEEEEMVAMTPATKLSLSLLLFFCRDEKQQPRP